MKQSDVTKLLAAGNVIAILVNILIIFSSDKIITIKISGVLMGLLAIYWAINFANEEIKNNVKNEK